MAKHPDPPGSRRVTVLYTSDEFARIEGERERLAEIDERVTRTDVLRALARQLPPPRG